MTSKHDGLGACFHSRAAEQRGSRAEGQKGRRIAEKEDSEAAGDNETGEHL